MIQFPLALRLYPQPVHAPAAWFIPGGSAELWLEEITQWGIATAPLRMLILPASLSDRSPAGLLVISPDAGKVRTRRAQAYGCIAERLFLPADCVLYPELAEVELRRELIWDSQVLHPAIGLVGFKQEQVLTIASLLAPPRRRSSVWDQAVAGLPPRPQLQSVLPEQVPTVEQLIQESQEGIGTEDPGTMAPLPEESAISKMSTGSAMSVARAMEWLLSKMPSGKAGAKDNPAGGAEPSFAQRLQAWMHKKMASWNESLQAAQNREIARLMRMLRDDPDEGLRHALRLADLPTRGLAPPPSQLTPRNPDFNLSHLRGGGPAGNWSTSWDIVRMLTEQYRQAANRELLLKRFRRAAYIYAELLGDFASAANALKQGRFFREAAVLYREKTHSIQLAAQCLEEGGLLAEAIPLYESTSAYAKAAELYERLGRPDAARAAYRIAVAQSIAVNDPITAAELLETKLAVPDEALALLLEAWPGSPKAAVCLHKAFDLMGRLGKHDEAVRRIGILRSGLPGSGMVLPLVETLAVVATSYPNDPVRHRAADAARVTVGERLSAAAGTEAASLVNTLARLDSGDRLLKRDCDRFLNIRPVKPPVRQAQPPRPNPLKLVRSFQLPADVQWKSVLGTTDCFHALGVQGGRLRLMLVTGLWDGTMYGTGWTVPTARDDRFLMQYLSGQRMLAIARLPRPGALEPRPLGLKTTALDWPAGGTAGELAFLSGVRVASMFCDENDVLWVVQGHNAQPEKDLWDLCAYEGAGRLMATHLIGSVMRLGEPSVDYHVVARQGTLYTTVGRGLKVGPNHEDMGINLPGWPRQLIASGPFVPVQLAVAFDEGGAVIWPAQKAVQPFAVGILNPVIAMTYDGLLIAVGRGEGRLYTTHESHVQQQVTFPAGEQAPVAVLRTNAARQFAIFNPSGLVQVMAYDK